MSTQLKRAMPLPYDLLRSYTTSLLNVLAYLHDKAVTHKDLRVGISPYSQLISLWNEKYSNKLNLERSVE